MVADRPGPACGLAHPHTPHPPGGRGTVAADPSHSCADCVTFTPQPSVRDDSGAGVRHRAPRGSAYWIEIRLGGQYVAMTLPIRLPRGTEPQRRESHDSPRLSPMKKYEPFGTCHVRPA